MSIDADRLAGIALFADLPETDRERLAAHMESYTLAPGEILFNEGDEGDRAYVLLEGHLEVTNAGPWQPLVVGESRPGDLVGEMALLRDVARSATATATVETTLATLTRQDLETLITTGSAASAVYQTLLDRWEETRDRLRGGERVAQLGVLAAGVAHELNNPSAAVGRGADALGRGVGRLVAANLALGRAGLGAGVADAIEETLAMLGEARGASSLGSIERLDRQEAMESTLAGLGVPRPDQVAAEAVGLGIDDAMIQRLAEVKEGEKLALVFEVVLAAGALRQLATEIGWAAGQISAIVATLGSYSRLDRAPTAEVDVVDGLEQTVSLLSHRLEGIEVVRDYATDLPTVTATETELNQVWTNLIANAADATGGGGRITLRTRATPDAVIVEVEDDGPGISPDNLARIFYAFYTTKEPGKGIGLGLAVTQRIVAVDHQGELTAESEPGCTVFRVSLPRTSPSDEHATEHE